MKKQVVAKESLSAFMGVRFWYDLGELRKAYEMLSVGLLSYILETLSQDWKSKELRRALHNFLLGSNNESTTVFDNQFVIRAFYPIYAQVHGAKTNNENASPTCDVFALHYNQCADLVNAFSMENFLAYIGDHKAYYQNRIVFFGEEIKRYEQQFQCGFEAFESMSDQKHEQPLSDIQIIDQWENAILQHERFNNLMKHEAQGV